MHELLTHPQVLVFVNSVDAGIRVRLFLEAFGVRAAVLNAELPLNSRHHILQVRAWGFCFYLLFFCRGEGNGGGFFL